MRTADFHYELPPELIAQAPAAERDQSRLLVLHRSSGRIEHRRFPDLTDFLRAGDVLVLNDSRVIPARLRGVNPQTGGQFEFLLLEQNSVNDWWAMVRPGKRAQIGSHIAILDAQKAPTSIQAIVTETNAEGHRRLQFTGTPDVFAALNELGEVPLPPYIQRDPGAPNPDDRSRYQTVFAQPPGSVAAPTAGLHFTDALLDTLRARGVQVCFVTLHVGVGTFAPVKTDTLAGHRMHEERYTLGEATANAINLAKREGRRVVAVGTTTVRVLESCALTRPSDTLSHPMGEGGGEGKGVQHPTSNSKGSLSHRTGGGVTAGAGRTDIFIYPPFKFQIVDALLTNFHLPCSTLLMLVSAFASPGETHGREKVLTAYAEAVRERYRFYSYGDAMFIE